MSSSPAGGSGGVARPGLTIPGEFQALLRGRETLLVSSRDRAGVGTVRMWFALSEEGRLYLLTPSYSLKARRWVEDPWVRVRAGSAELEGRVHPVAAQEVGDDRSILLERFAMAGAVTPEALSWMLESGSHLLFLVVAEGGG